MTATTQAVILAAGFGSRLDADEGHKLMVRLGGKPLLDYHLANFARLGVDDLVVVTGYRHQALEAALDAATLPPGMTVRCAHNPDFDGPNGLSVLAAAEVLAEDQPFWLTMSDHLFSPAIFEDLARRFEDWKGPDVDGVLCIDGKLDQIYDMPDATKLRLSQKGRPETPLAIGKELSDFNAVDVGLFWCAPAFIQALADEYDAQGGCSTSDAVRRLYDDGAFAFWDIGDALWQDVDTPGARAHADKLLRQWQAHR